MSDTPAPLEPLSDDQIDDLRRQVMMLAPYPAHDAWRTDVGRLLSTLDAERAAKADTRDLAEAMAEASAMPDGFHFICTGAMLPDVRYEASLLTLPFQNRGVRGRDPAVVLRGLVDLRNRLHAEREESPDV